MTRLGNRQLAALAVLGSPFSAVVVPDATQRSLLARGLLLGRGAKAGAEGGICSITPAGLRALADEMERGRIEPMLLDKLQRVSIYMDMRRVN